MSGLNQRIALVCGLLALACPLAGSAAVTSCTVSVSGVVFGTYTPLTPTALLANGAVNIVCSGINGNNSITIDLSPGVSGNYTTRTLTGGALALTYNLYSDGSYTQVWGNGTGGSVEQSTSIRKESPNATLTIYGAVDAGQDPAPGGYGDTITVSVNY